LKGRAQAAADVSSGRLAVTQARETESPAARAFFLGIEPISGSGVTCSLSSASVLMQREHYCPDGLGEVELLTPMIGKESRRPIRIEPLGVAATPLRFLDSV